MAKDDIQPANAKEVIAASGSELSASLYAHAHD